MVPNLVLLQVWPTSRLEGEISTHSSDFVPVEDLFYTIGVIQLDQGQTRVGVWAVLS